MLFLINLCITFVRTWLCWPQTLAFMVVRADILVQKPSKVLSSQTKKPDGLLLWLHHARFWRWRFWRHGQILCQVPTALPEIATKWNYNDFELNKKGTLLDLGCGTGELAIPLANHFTSVLALDPDDGMLQEGRKKAKKAKVDNIK